MILVTKTSDQTRQRGVFVCVCVCVCIYDGWRELLTQHDSPTGVTAYLRSARAAVWRSLCLSCPRLPPRLDGPIVPDSARACVL